MAVSIAAKLLGGLRAALFVVALHTSFAAAEVTTKGIDFVRVIADQMHQLEVVKVVPHAFLDQRSAIGQIAFSEDASTIVMTPFSGRVTRLIAKVGDQVRRGDPLLEIDSPDQVPPQNDFIAAQTARNKARSQLSLAQIVEKRARDLYEGKATPVQGIAAAEAQLVAAENDMRSTDTAFEAARIRLRIVGRTDTEITALEQHGTITRVTPINAPIDGTVISRKVGPGQLVKADSGEALYVIADLSTMWLKAQIFEQEIASLRVGQEMEAKVAAAPNRIFKARPAVPTVAVIREGDVATVWVETEPMLFKRRVVEIGIQQEGFTQVRSGLAIGELVVARGAIFVDDGVASRIFRLGVIDAA